MTGWPDKPLIRIIRGTISGKPLINEIAQKTETGNYAIAKHLCVKDYDGDSIDEWEEVAAVPTTALKRLRDERGRETSLHNLRAAIDDVLACLLADKPSPLDWAVTRVKDAGGPLISERDSSENRISLLFDALASITVATNKATPLVTVAHICVDWVDLENPRRDSLETARERVKVFSDPGSFIVLSALVGNVTTALCDNLSPRHDLIDVAAYALAWAAQIIEEEDK